MLKSMRTRADVLTVHGVLSLLLGAAFLYVGATITNLFFEALAVIVVLVLSAAALLLAAITDWLAAIGEGPLRRHSFVLYTGSGAVMAVTAVVLGYAPQATTEWLMGLGSAHALLFGSISLLLGTRVRRHHAEQRMLVAAGGLSILLSGAIAGLAVSGASVAAQIALLGAYLLFAGGKMLFLAYELQRTLVFAAAQAARILPMPSARRYGPRIETRIETGIETRIGPSIAR
ncbi:hypothetical protein [Silvibacterium sp.]|uniref:hypothetical protein n=1 Tax=Silvibacterium sp. TaxID=1964179 RepID=UPI0039E323EA